MSHAEPPLDPPAGARPKGFNGLLTDACRRSGVTVTAIDAVGDLAAANRILSEIWDNGGDAMPVNLLKAMAHAGHYVAAAWRDGSMVGAVAAFAYAPGFGARLHSHIAGVEPGLQGRGVGAALKMHQAVWAAERGLDTVTWTFDPLVRRNARFNVNRLGARITGYMENFYGPMADTLNAGGESDRCMVEWDVSGDPPAPPAPPPTAATAPPALAVGANEEPISVRPGDDAAILCQVPEDIVAIRRRDPLLARRWRRALRAAMEPAMASGFTVTAVTGAGAYLLERDRA
jgi:predicted GNAT superfamily acetyltransferase